MRLPALNHLVEAAVALSRCERLTVLGSSALLPSFPELGEHGGPLETTFDADLLLEPCDEAMAAMLHEALGEGSLFEKQTGFHADILRAAIIETLPPGWETRLVRLGAAANAAALAPEDLFVVKLRAGREKDLALCGHLLKSGRLSPETVRARLNATPLPERESFAVYRRWQELLG